MLHSVLFQRSFLFVSNHNCRNPTAIQSLAKSSLNRSFGENLDYILTSMMKLITEMMTSMVGFRCHKLKKER